MAARRRTQTERPVDIILETRLPDSRSCFGGCGSRHCGDRSCLALDAATLGASGCGYLVSALFAPKRQLIVFCRTSR
jgi:hypothetical protein